MRSELLDHELGVGVLTALACARSLEWSAAPASTVGSSSLGRGVRIDVTCGRAAAHASHVRRGVCAVSCLIACSSLDNGGAVGVDVASTMRCVSCGHGGVVGTTFSRKAVRALCCGWSLDIASTTRCASFGRGSGVGTALSHKAARFLCRRWSIGSVARTGASTALVAILNGGGVNAAFTMR